MNEGGGGLAHNRINKIYKSTDGGTTWTNTYTGPTFPAPGRTTCPNSYFACMFSHPGGYWRHMGWGQPAALNGVVHYVYDSRNTGNGDPGDVFYIRSTDGGVTFSAPFKLNTDTTTRPQWQPNISVAADGSLLAVWYDERETTTCTKGNSGVPCYRMWARKSIDGGVTWQPDEAFSDVISPLPGQPDSSIVTEYAGDYDYSFVGGQPAHPSMGGRARRRRRQFPAGCLLRSGGRPGAGLPLRSKRRVQTTRSNHKVQLKWSPADGGSMNILRDGNVVGTTPDDGNASDNLGTRTGTFVYQVCETDTGDCSNEVTVVVQ